MRPVLGIVLMFLAFELGWGLRGLSDADEIQRLRSAMAELRKADADLKDASEQLRIESDKLQQSCSDLVSVNEQLRKLVIR